ncbi:universal stress protein [Nocardia ninae]|uniref:Universal stress protein n=1 Tax=Nocardia ninae NBRC 108245 TaxID=1210091 RepID=A0A511MPN5_9NOCA|nr:universal stress protein [Nocardia ninae]GEM42544.1 universal stress protein [Nocardia ninae NBRC 108245]
MATPHGNPHQLAKAPVVVGVDGSFGSDLAVRWAAELAAQRGRTLLIAHGLDLAAMRSVVGGYDIAAASFIETARAQGAETVAHAHRLATAVAPDLHITTETTDASAAEMLIQHSRTAYLVAIGATGNLGTIAHLGSTLLAVVSHGHGTIVVVRETDTEQHIRTDGPVVVGIDGGPVSEAAIAAAFAEAAARGTDLIATHSWNYWQLGDFAGEPYVLVAGEQIESTEDAILIERLAGWQEKYPDVTVTRKVYRTEPTEQLAEWSNSAQLIVVGSRGRGGFTGMLLGSTSHFLVQHAHCPVLVAHPE